MISLEQIHREMNSKVIRDIASIVFDRWLSSHFNTKAKIKHFISAEFRYSALAPTKHQLLAVEALLNIKHSNYIKERKTLTIDEELEQCDICLRYYRIEALDNCDSCHGLVCVECSVPDEEFDLVFCSECKD